MTFPYKQWLLILQTALFLFATGLEKGIALYAQDDVTQSSEDSSKMSSRPHPVFVLPEEYTESGRKAISDRLRSVGADSVS
ncbi:MAG: hypothetical protein IKW80_10460, partial [Thermoguttaceae bacterium]|nr:hypothetical protein [Thermoguttaceae bacterium]